MEKSQQLQKLQSSLFDEENTDLVQKRSFIPSVFISAALPLRDTKRNVFIRKYNRCCRSREWGDMGDIFWPECVESSSCQQTASDSGGLRTEAGCDQGKHEMWRTYHSGADWNDAGCQKGWHYAGSLFALSGYEQTGYAV